MKINKFKKHKNISGIENNTNNLKKNSIIYMKFCMIYNQKMERNIEQK